MVPELVTSRLAENTPVDAAAVPCTVPKLFRVVVPEVEN